MKFDTASIHGHEHEDQNYGAIIPPLYLSAIYKQIGEARKSDRNVDLKYSREENPTVRMLEHVIARLEEAEDALCFSSGMAAISTLLLAYLRRGDKVLIPYEIYGATLELIQDLQKFDIKISYTWPETNDILESIERDVKLIIIETMTNPTLKVIDVREVVKKSLENNSIIIIDNTFVTPVLYQPIPDGATFVLHSMTKYMSGHNDTVAGVIAGSSRDIRNLWNWRRKVGTILAPFEAYLVMRGIKTLSLRVKKHCENAKIIAEYLKEHSKIEEVLYPGLPENKYHDIAKKLFKNGFGGVVSFKIRGSYGEVIKLLKNLKIIKPSPSLGGPETLLTYPIVSASKVIPEEIRRKLGITENLLRMSVGLEDINDIIEDLDNALKQIP